MPRVDREAELCDCPPPKVGEEGVRNLHLSLTLATNEVTMRLGREVISGRPVPEVRVHDHSKALELLEVPVHSRNRHVWCLCLNLRGELFSGSVSGRLE